MGGGKFSNLIKFYCRDSVWILAFCWVSGICTGLYFGLSIDPEVLSLMRAASVSRVSIVGLLLSLLFPVVLSAAAVRFSSPDLFHLLAAGKGLCHGFCMYMILAEFASAGWLLFRLLLFSDSCVLIPLFILWLRHIDGQEGRFKRDLWCCICVAVIAVLIDYFIISPLIITSINHS